ncbi:MAG TPA: DUF4920 domain-containing protein [Thermoanaerobaculia bacterium]|nr:DUF4920 domain-containing protein [Thermoanaerobaculia bacterium]
MKTVLALALTLGLSGCAATTPAPETVYGRPRALTTAPLTLAAAASEANVGKTLAVQAPAAEVCQNKGCWMVLTEGTRSVRVTFQDYGFFVPKDIAGKTVVVEGVLSRKLLSAEEAKHYAEESGATSTSPAGPREEWSLLATSVVVPGG